MKNGFRLIGFALCLAAAGAGGASGQTVPEPDGGDAADKAPVEKSVVVEPKAADTAIAGRLLRILRSTEWFESPSVTVRDGVAFIEGTTGTRDHKAWATDLAQKTQDVVAVVNRIHVEPRPTWDFQPAFREITTMSRSAIQALPHLLLGIVILTFAWFIASLVRRLANTYFSHRVASQLLALVLARAVAIPFFLAGLYVVLQLSGLTRLALTILGGTGVVGIVVGFAFRDIAENFLASILLSIRRPFLANDFVDIGEHFGLVSNMNARTTVLMTQEGNHVHIPNATVFKGTITNYTSNPNYRSSFVLTIGYDSSITKAQDIVLALLDAHDAVLADPAPMVLVDDLTSSTINLRVYYWFDFARLSEVKLRSHIMRRALRELESAGITSPDEAREVVFPDGVPVTQLGDVERKAAARDATKDAAARSDVAGEDKRGGEMPTAAVGAPEDISSRTEGGLESESSDLREQVERSSAREDSTNLLNPDEGRES